jgi:hypothetical protein
VNVFVLNAGRCGSTTFIRACQHMRNYTAAHESRATLIDQARLAYAPRHIEADNRLSWLLGRLDREYADNAFYVHLTRDIAASARSFVQRENFGIMQAYREGILLGGETNQSAYDIAIDYLKTCDANIALFLKDKQHKMPFRLETAKADFCQFWRNIQAEGDLPQALLEWDVAYNAST